MKLAPMQSSFNAGEFSPLLYGRSDVDKYKNAMATCVNARLLVEGGWQRRSGEYFVCPTKDNGQARLVRFEFGVTQTYILELGNLYMRPYKDNGAILLASQNITGITQANPAVLTYTGSDTYANGDEVEITGVVGMTQVNGRRFRVAGLNAGANTFQLLDVDGTNINSTGYTAYSSGGTVSEVYTETTVYPTAVLFDLRLAQNSDTMYVAHSSYAPYKITRTSHSAWTATKVRFIDGPYQNLNTSGTTLTLSATNGHITVTASAVTGINNNQGFLTTDVGRLIRWKDPANNWTWMIIETYVNSTEVTAEIQIVASATTATANWRLGAWSDTTGFPAAVCFNEDRLVFGGTTTEPQRLDFSNTSIYEDFSPSNAAGTIAASNGFTVTLNSNDVNAIKWLSDGENDLLVGTTGGEWVVKARSTGDALSATNTVARRSGKWGSASVDPLRAGKALLYVQRSGRKVRELAYVFDDNGYKSANMNRFSQHITYGGVKQLAYEQEPYSTVWGVRNDGTLLGFTYNREESVFGWQRHTPGGYSDSAQQTAAIYESVESIPASDGVRDETWCIVKRYINGATRRYVGYFKKAWERGQHHHDAFFVDAGLSLNNTVAQTLTPGTGANVDATTGVTFTAGGSVFTANDVGRYIHYDYTDEDGVIQRANARITGYTSGTVVTATILYPWPNLTLIASGGWRMTVTTVSGLWHLEGQTVAVFGDGATQPTKTVASGSITLTYPASKVAVGLAYNSDAMTMRPEQNGNSGTSQGKLRRIHRLVMRVHDTLGLKLGPSFTNLTQIVFRTSANPASVAPPLFSGDKVVEFEGDSDRDGYICWRQDQPEPATVLAIMPEMNVSD